MLAVQFVVLLSCAGLCLDYGHFGGLPIETMPEYRESIREIRTNEEIRQKLGGPVEVDMSDFRFRGESGDVGTTYEFRITGPEGVATAKVETVKVDESWQYRKFIVIFEDGSGLDLRQ